MNVSVLSYTVLFSENAGNKCTTQKNVSNFTCRDSICMVITELPLSPCPFSSKAINVSLSATNQLGGGPTSDEETFGMSLFKIV